LLVAAGALVVSFAVFAAWFVSTFQPIRANAGGMPTLVRGDETNYGQFIDPTGGPPFSPHAVQYHDGKTFVYGFTLVNDGPVSLTVDAIGSPGGAPLRQISVRTGVSSSIYSASATDPTRPFEPFVLAPHAERFVEVVTRFAGCSLGSGVGSAVTVVSLRVQFRFFGVHRQAFLPLPYALRVTGNDGCPGG